jgi:hypothetical protein
MDGTVSTPSAKQTYSKPRLVVYGSLAELTLTEVEVNPMNDMYGNFKTI